MSEELVTSAQSAVDSLQRLATELEQGPVQEALALKGPLTWGWHAVAQLAYMRMQPRREQIDGWLWDYLDEGSPGLELERDAHWQERQRLSLLELLDLFSEVDLPLLEPEFYQGWTDRTVRCQTLRRQIAQIVGSGLKLEQRDGLLVLLAAYHRLLRFPAEVTIDVVQIREELPHLLDMLQVLVDPSGPSGAELRELIGRSRAAMATW